MLVFYIFVILIGIVFLYLAIIVFWPGFHVPQQLIPGSKPGTREKISKLPTLRLDVNFDVCGIKIKAWLYLPDNVSATVPCIVMNHGFGGTRDVLLENYVLRFQDAGMAVLTFDYRHFGESDGEPRQLFAIKSQLEDCSAAINYARNRTEIDPDKIAVWGTSAGGGYGFAIAAKDKKIAAVCARAILTTGNYNPVNYAKDIHCPVLIQVCEKDNLVSPQSAEKAARILGEKAEIIRYPIGHFDIYTGDHFHQAVSNQIEFFKKNLTVAKQR